MLEGPPCLVTGFVKGRELTAEELREPETLEEVARALRAYHDSDTELPTSFDSFQLVDDYASRAREHGGSRPRSSSRCPGARYPGRPPGPVRARASGLPQRPSHRKLPARRRTRADHRLGVRRHGRPLHHLDGQDQQGSSRTTRSVCSTPTSVSRRTKATRVAEAVPFCDRLPRGHVGRGADQLLRARLRLSRLRREALRAPGPDRCGQRFDTWLEARG